MTTDDKMNLLSETGGFALANHNQTDFESFKDFQAELDARYQKLEEERSLQERAANLKKWDEALPPRWRSASLKTMDRPEATRVEGLIERQGFTSFFLRGESASGKTFMAFAIARRYISLGLVTPSQVKVISEETLLSIPKLGFQGHERFDKLFSEKYKLFIFDNVGSREVYDKREGPLWEQLLDHIYSKNLAAIFTSTGSARYLAERLSTPAGSKLRQLVEGRVIPLEPREAPKREAEGLDELTPEEAEREQRADARVRGVQRFKS